MKKILCLTAVLILGITVLQGCSARQETTEKKVTSRQKDISQVSKAQKIDVISLKDGKTIVTLNNKDDIRRLLEELKIDEWKAVKDIPDGEKSVYRCDLYQVGTKKLNKDSDGKMKKIGSLTFYRDSKYVSMKILAFDLNFKVPVDAEEILKEL